MRLEGKRALITGGASGLGRAIAQLYQQEGATVHIFDRNEVTEEPFTSTQGDVTDVNDVQRAQTEALAAMGGLDIYVGNAGIWDYSRPLTRMSLADIDRTFDELMGINVKGYLLGARAALPSLIDGGGCMIFTLSNAAFHPDGGGTLYTASKHAALGLVRQLAFELAPHVRVNGVAPGAMASSLAGPNSMAMGERNISDLPIGEGIKGALPIDQWADPAACASAYVFLASAEESGMSTGSVVRLEGGWEARGLTRARGGDELKTWRETIEQ